jgi:hypothetical protein
MSGPVFHWDGSSPEGDDWVFVFGSNLAGRHGAGAARAALQFFGAEYGVGEGPTGRAYAIPTLGRKFEQLSLPRIQEAVTIFLAHACANPAQRFFVTRIGCGLAGRSDADIAPMFANAPANCSFAEAWRPWIEENVRGEISK